MQSCNYCDSAVYSASVLLSAIWIFILEAHMIGHPLYIILYPVCDFVVPTYLWSVGFYRFPQKSESA